MRKAAIFFLVLLCSAISYGQEPQWTVVKHVFLTQQTANIFHTTLLTPTEPSLYRISAYLSGGVGGSPRTNAVWTATLAGSDITGAAFKPAPLQVPCNQTVWLSAPSIIISLEPQVPLTYQVIDGGGGLTCQYNLAITVEQLVQQ
jgi:hypothetical protein